MSEQAQTLIKAAMRAMGVLAAGETPTAAELSDGLECMRLMMRHWSDTNARIYYTTQDSIAMTGATYYTIGTGGDFDVDRPESIRGAYVDSTLLDIIDEARYRKLRLITVSSTAGYLWYSPEYPLGKLYVIPTGGTTFYLDSLKPLADVDSLTALLILPPGYYEAIKWNLAIRLCPEFNREPSVILLGLAKAALNDIETRNFDSQINAVNLNKELGRTDGYDIDSG